MSRALADDVAFITRGRDIPEFRRKADDTLSKATT